jgi:hypothetical protein
MEFDGDKIVAIISLLAVLFLVVRRFWFMRRDGDGGP